MTHTTLRIDASGRHDGSTSRDLTDRIVSGLGGTLITRDLALAPPSFVDGPTIGAYFTPPSDRTDDQQRILHASDQIVAEIQSADTLVIGVPIYNFGVPAALKAWADQAARVGVTFQYTPNGPKGLLTGKRAIIVAASAGTQVGSDIDFATPWLRFFLGFIGITDVSIIAADQLTKDGPAKLKQAQTAIDSWLQAA